jgi:beta-glucanase (GH16 family)
MSIILSQMVSFFVATHILLLSAHAKANPPLPNYSLAWRDEFNGAQLDETKWTARDLHWGETFEDKESVFVKDGYLTVQTTTGADGLHHTGYLSTRNKFSATYGYYEAKINFQDAPGTWCAFWLVSDRILPMSAEAVGIEIDIVESLPGHNDSYPVHVHNWNVDQNNNQHTHVGLHAQNPSPSRPLQGNDHVYAVEWTPEGYQFFLNGALVWQDKTYLSHDKKYVILNCHVNGKTGVGWAGSIPAEGFGTPETSTTRMKVDWVRVWQKTDSVQPAPKPKKTHPFWQWLRSVGSNMSINRT